MNRVGAILPVALVAVLASVAATEERRETDTNFNSYKPLAAAGGKAEKVVLDEGPPHQFFENNYRTRSSQPKDCAAPRLPVLCGPLPL